MNVLEQIVEYYYDCDFLKADGFDDAILGVDETSMKLVYSVKKALDVLVKNGLTYEEAIEHMDYNVLSAYVGDKTPIWCNDIF